MSGWTPEAVYKLISSLATLSLALWLIVSGQNTQDILIVIAMINQIIVAHGTGMVTKVLTKGGTGE